MADETSLSGVTLPGDPTMPLEAAPMQYVDQRVGSSMADIAHYGDYWSTMPRLQAAAAKTLALGVSYFSSSIASDSFTATKLRYCCWGGSSGTGIVRASIYTGPALSALTLRASMPNNSSTFVPSIYEPTLTAGVSITAGQYVCVGFLVTGYTTIPSFMSLTGSGSAALISPTSAMRYAAQSPTGQTALPTGTITMGSYTAVGTPHWFALAS